MPISLNNFLALITDSKITGKGRLGNAKIYAMLTGVLADRESGEITSELNILKKFGSITEDSDSWHRLDRFISRYIKTGTGYPYEAFSFSKFEESFSNEKRYRLFISEMQKNLDKIIDNEKINSLVYTLICAVNDDENFTEIFYGGRYISKKEFAGRAAHIKRICVPAFIAGIIYHLHVKPVISHENSISLLPAPEKYTFETIHYENENSFILETDPDISEMIRKTAKNICASEIKNSAPEKIFDTEKNINLSGTENIFIYGTGGIGKTTLLRKNLLMENCTCMYFPLYNYTTETESFPWTAVQILLKYIYQYEYSTLELCCASEGRENVIKNLSELISELKSSYETPRYVIMLDGINEMQPEYQDIFSDEIKTICHEWKNIRIIVSGREIPKYSVFRNFRHIEITPVTQEKVTEILDELVPEAEFNPGSGLLDILGIPLFLNLFIKMKNRGADISTCGEIIDSYINDFGSDRPENSLMRFTVQYILPFAAKKMNDDFCFEISRAELSQAADRAFETYIMNENVYQNYLSVKNFRKKSLLKNRERFDIVEYITENICLMKSVPGQPHLLYFTHQYFKDYFAARHIINIFKAADVSYGYGFNEEKKEMFCSHDLDLMWTRKTDTDFFIMLGEITGDYKNRYCENFVYSRTVLDEMLDFIRNFVSVHAAENIMLTMKESRDGIICGADFSSTTLPIYFPENTYFSADGKFPCIFRKCWVFNIRDYEKSKKCFINCDFSDSEFFDDECRDFLAEHGAVVTESEF